MCQGCLCRGNTFAYPGSVGPEVLELVEEPTIPNPGTGDVRIKVLAAGTGFTDSFIRRGRYPDLKGPLPFTPGYELVGVVDKAGSDVVSPREGQIVADSAWWVVTRNMQFVRRVFLFRFRMASMRQRPFAYRSPTLQLSTCSRAIGAYSPARGSSLSARPVRSVRRCSISRVILASRQSVRAQRRTSPQLSDLVRQQSTIGLVTSLLRCVNSRRNGLAAPASMRHSMRSADPISTGRSPVIAQIYGDLAQNWFGHRLRGEYTPRY